MFLTSLVILCIHTGMFWFVWDRFYNDRIHQPFVLRGNWLILLVYVILLFTFSRIYGGYKIGYLRVSEVVYSQFLTLLFVNFITYCQISLIGRWLLNIWPMVFLTLAEMAATVLWALVSNWIYFRLYPPRRMIIVYGNDSAAGLIKKMNQRADKYKICASISIEEGLDEVFRQIQNYESVIICDVKTQLRNKLVKYCFDHSIRIYITPKISDIILRGAEDINLFDTPLLLCRNKGLTFEQRFMKRALDLLLSSVAIVLTSPFMLIVAIAIKCYDGGPVLFKQKRCTLGGKVFEIYKFRSMIVDAEKNGNAHPATQDDPRITPVGRIIRKTRLDELPQLFNILLGDMSVVGPRPERVEHVERYTKEIPEFSFRLKVKGGLTGYAQIVGKYNTSAYDKLKLDLMYIENYSFLMDLKLILMTIKIMFMKESTEGFSAEDIESKHLNISDSISPVAAVGAKKQEPQSAFLTSVAEPERPEEELAVK
ncbi:MAG TPA: sugar transferase [Candidatus Gallacutalibacter stercoravium]|nr:sugar transferase [Candidatus Gallacutalibacter stercoravium]